MASNTNNTCQYLWSESAIDIAHFVANVDANKINNEDSIRVLQTTSLPAIRKIYKTVRDVMSEHGCKATANLFIPIIGLTYAELATFALIKRKTKS